MPGGGVQMAQLILQLDAAGVVHPTLALGGLRRCRDHSLEIISRPSQQTLLAGKVSPSSHYRIDSSGVASELRRRSGSANQLRRPAAPPLSQRHSRNGGVYTGEEAPTTARRAILDQRQPDL